MINDIHNNNGNHIHFLSNPITSLPPLKEKNTNDNNKGKRKKKLNCNPILRFV